ncbi:hypothetical protein FJW08_25155 [Mesorhizobium sp. B3-2-1]|uniref:hypothetical protein n=1 Tax=Mesorhizobium sp. B3-2-1 TaxID=2589891 RepID=UPI00112C0CA2|nr:hypothetical protein [Mesorhizobium sp. B3-2-1]TPI27111.1 hypothetical protein FJW08_25155 [Mesorhizobium sp. B3-2-1]
MAEIGRKVALQHQAKALDFGSFRHLVRTKRFDCNGLNESPMVPLAGIDTIHAAFVFIYFFEPKF